MNKIFALLLFSFIAWGCDKEYELKESVFIPDPNYPGLPQYSEWGYNTFGAYYDRTPFISPNVDAPVKIRVSEGSTKITLYGKKGIPAEAVELSITLPRYAPAEVSELVSLHQVEVDLTGNEVEVALSLDHQQVDIEVIEGSLTFTRAQSLLVDKEFHEVILSGRFELKLLVEGTGVTISDGRFDLGVGPDVFFVQ